MHRVFTSGMEVSFSRPFIRLSVCFSRIKSLIGCSFKNQKMGMFWSILDPIKV